MRHRSQWDAGQPLFIVAAAAVAALSACSRDGSGIASAADDAGAKLSFDREELLDPETCKECHPVHYEQWAGSMHAYAADDPVFLAMNQRGQDEVQIGAFCVNCHAPMAVAEGVTDGTNLDEVPKRLRGVTCYFCHNVDKVEGDHNNPLVLANDTTMRGGIGSYDTDPPPTPNTKHGSAYSELVDSNSASSSKMCGACHDIVLEPPLSAKDVHLERTYAEYQKTVYATDNALTTCAYCHAKRDGSRTVIADFDGVPGGRRVHQHDFEGVDLALTDFPNADRQRLLVNYQLATSVGLELCVSQTGGIKLIIENTSTGHYFPSGATQDRRMWPEIIATRAEADGTTTTLYQTGVVEDGQALTDIDDPDLWVLRDTATDADGNPAHMFWDIVNLEPNQIVGVITTDQTDPNFHAEVVGKQFAGSLGLGTVPDRVTLRFRVRPMGLDVLADIQENPGLPDAVVQAMPTFTILPNFCYPADLRPELNQPDCSPDDDPDAQTYTLVWTPDAAAASKLVDTVDGEPAQCVADAALRR